MKVSSLFVHPVKSMRGLELQSAEVEARGLAGDRRWVVADEDGVFLTQRTCTGLAKFDASYEGEDLVLGFDGARLCVAPPAADRKAVTVWKDTISAADAGDEAADWLSSALERKVRLYHMDDVSERSTSAKWGAQGPVSFADAYPILVTSTTSLDALNTSIAGNGGEAVGMRRFRPNIVIEGADPWAEDFWKVIRIGDLVIDLVKPCDRCVMTTLDPETGAKAGREPLKTLNKIRRSAHPDLQGVVLFGWTSAPRGTGKVAVGDAVEILEGRPEGWPLA